MGVAERERERNRLFRELLPEIVADLIEGTDVFALSERLASAHGVERSDAYRWALHAEEQIERRRKRDAIPAILLIWVGATLLVTGAALWLLRGFSVIVPIAALAGGGALVSSMLLLRDLRVKSARRWMKNA